LKYGNEAQKKEHLPKIAAGLIRWCQGYSEPNAGSDLASLQTRAVDAGDHWVINGQKTWTSGAQYSDWCGLLTRTDPTARKHDGISFMLVGSFAGSYYGVLRSTQDIDLVISARLEQLTQLVQQLQAMDYYAEPSAALEALQRQSMFNVIDNKTGEVRAMVEEFPLYAKGVGVSG